MSRYTNAILEKCMNSMYTARDLVNALSIDLNDEEDEIMVKALAKLRETIIDLKQLQTREGPEL